MVELESAELLNKKGIDYRIIELEERAITVADVIKYSKGDIKPEEICKTIIVKDQKGNMFAIFLLGDHKIDEKKAKKAIKSKIKIAGLEEIRKALGIGAGAICPIILDIPIFVDTKVLTRDRLNFGSGNHLFGIEISSKDLNKIIDYKVVDIAKV